MTTARPLLSLLLALACGACVAVESERPASAGVPADVHLPRGLAADDEVAARLLESRGTAALLGGRWAEAHAVFSAVPSALLSPEVRRVAGRAALLADDPEAARALLTAHLEAHPDDDAARLDLARAELLRGAPGKALAQLGRLPAARRDDAAGHELTALAHLARGAHGSAAWHLRAALARGADAPSLEPLLAHCVAAALAAAGAPAAETDLAPPDGDQP